MCRWFEMLTALTAAAALLQGAAAAARVSSLSALGSADQTGGIFCRMQPFGRVSLWFDFVLPHAHDGSRFLGLSSDEKVGVLR
jgi:hypothetical protein